MRIVDLGYTVAVVMGVGLVTQHNASYTYDRNLSGSCSTPAAMAAARLVFRNIATAAACSRV